MADIIFIDGMSFFDPPKQAPEYVKGRIGVNVGKFIEFADKHQKNGFLNIEIKESKKGNTYLSLVPYLPKLKPQEDDGTLGIDLEQDAKDEYQQMQAEVKVLNNTPVDDSNTINDIPF